MKKTTLIVSLFTLFLFVQNTSRCADASTHASWTVVGAGPSGILALGIILDSGVPADKIAWLDPEFNVGRMGKCYRNVPGNGKVCQYLDLLNMCKVFGEVKSESIEQLYNLPLEHTPKLTVFVDSFSDISNYLRTKVNALQDEMIALDYHNEQWTIKTKTTSFISDNVVLATGAHPRHMHYEGITQIPLDVALDKSTLAQQVTSDDTVAVIGSGHSALLILKHLSELSVKSVINFYRKPIVYQTPMRGGIAWKESGLKGDVATWAKTVLEVFPPKNLSRVLSSSENIKTWLPQCTKVICAIGFERNSLPSINESQSMYENYDRASGIIAPHLYGVGIAFAQQQVDPLGNVEYLVGLPYLRFDALYQALGMKDQNTRC